MTDKCRVVLRDFPLLLMQRAQQHSESLVREFALIVHGADDEDTRVPQRLLDLAAESERRYSGMNPEAQALAEAAIEQGIEFIDVEVHVPPSFKQEVIDAVPVLLEVEEYCRTGQLLSLVTPPDLRLFWEWYLLEFVRQIDGLPPNSWLDHLANPPGAMPPVSN
jgi:hypothetical protein